MHHSIVHRHTYTLLYSVVCCLVYTCLQLSAESTDFKLTAAACSVYAGPYILMLQIHCSRPTFSLDTDTAPACTPPPWVAHFLQPASLSRPHASNHPVTGGCIILRMLLTDYWRNHEMKIIYITLFKGQQLVNALQWATINYQPLFVFAAETSVVLKLWQQRVCHFYMMKHNSVKAWHR